MQLIYGSKAGQKKPHTPRISDDTVASITKITALYLLGEGEIRGLVNGSKSIYFEDTPLEDDNGHRNFENVEWEIRHGTVDQTHIPGVPSASTERVINTELRSSVPWTRLITDIELSSINVNVSWPRLSKMEDNGDVNGVTVDYAIDVRTDGGAWVTMVSKSLTAKTSGRYQRTHNIPLPDANNNWQVRVRKITEDGDNERLFNQMHIDSIAEIIDAKLCYPHSAVIKLTWDSRAFGNTPKVSFETYGRYVKVPVNYDAETRKSTGIWTGEFKEAFTTNPAWIYYDLITNDRYGLGNKLKPYMINKWAIEYIAKICDVMVDDGKGGLEPRYTCNLYLQTAETAFDVLQHIAGIFRGMAFWNGSQIILDADTYKDCDYVITRANVINGEFVKTGTAANERHTIAKVGYSNPDNNYEVDYVFVRNERAIAEIGINILDLSAIACTSEGEAYRFGLAALLTEQNRTQTVSFTMGLDGALPSVGDRIDIPDIMFTGHNTGGRISDVNKDRTIITVDRDNVPVALGDKLVVNLESGKAQTREILSINGREITVSKPFDAVSRENVWAVSSDELPTMSFIVLSVRANEDGTQYNYTALQYDATLQQQIDNGTIIENKPPLPPLVSMIIDAPQSIALSTRHRIEQAQTITTLVITWEQVKDAVAYDVEWRKDDGDWISVPRTGNISVEVDGVYSGNYIARVRAVSAFDAVSKPITSTLTKVEGKAGKPPSLLSLKATGTLFGMELNWSFAKGSGDAAYTEIQVASAPDTNVALLGQYSYPTNNAKLNGLQSGLVQYYRGRIVDKLGFKGDWSNWARGEVLNDSSQVLDLIAGDIEQSHLNQALGQKIDKIDVINQDLSQEVINRNSAITQVSKQIAEVSDAVTDEMQARIDALVDIDEKISAETLARATAVKENSEKISAEATARVQAVQEVNEAIIAEAVLRGKAVQGLESGFNTAITKLDAADAAITERIDTVVATTSKNTAAITSEIKARADNDSALSNRIDEVVAVSEDNTALISAESQARTDGDSALGSRIDTVVAKSDANTAAISSEAKARADEDSALSSRIDTVSSKTDDNAASITNVSNTLTNELGSQAEQINIIKADYSPRYADKTRYADKSRSAQWTYWKTVARDNYATNERITVLQSDVADSKAEITQSLNTLAKKDEALASSIDAIAVKTGSNTAAIQSESVARTDADSALSTRIDTVMATAGDNTAAIQSEIRARTDGDSALGSRIDTVVAKSDANTAAISSEAKARADEDSALSSRIDTVQSSTATAQETADEALGKANTATSNIATIKTELTATTSKTNATANQVTTIQTTVNGHTSSIQTQQTSINGLSAQSVLTLDVNGYVTGVGNYNDGKKGSFAVIADEFWIASPDNKSKVRPLVYYPSSTTINGVTVPSGLYLDGNLLATGTITGDKIRANTEINAPVIKGGQININDKFIVDSDGNLTGKSGTFEGTVLADKISGTIDVESMKKSAWTPHFKTYILGLTSFTMYGGWVYGYEREIPLYSRDAAFLWGWDDSMKKYKTSHVSFGSIVFIAPRHEQDIVAVLFEIDVDVINAVTVNQHIHHVDDTVRVYVNDTEVAMRGSVGPISFDLPKGKSTLSYILHNSGKDAGLILVGDFIDNVNVKFA